MVINPFPADCEFTLALLHEPAEPKPVPPPPAEVSPRRGSRRPAGGDKAAVTSAAAGTNAAAAAATPAHKACQNQRCSGVSL